MRSTDRHSPERRRYVRASSLPGAELFVPDLTEAGDSTEGSPTRLGRKLFRPQEAVATIPPAIGPYHDFWLIREGERDYVDYWDLVGRKDAPVRLLDDIMVYVIESFFSLPTVDREDAVPGRCNFDYHGVTVINRTGGEALYQICSGWARIFAQGTEPLILTRNYMYPADTLENEWRNRRFQTSRAKLAADMERLAEFGQKAASGEYFIFHLGI